MKQLLIRGSKTKIIFAVVLGTIIGIFSFQLFLNPAGFRSPRFTNVFFIKYLGLAFSAMMFIFVFIIAKKTYMNEFSLVVDEKGIYDQTNTFSVGFVQWSNISEITVVGSNPAKIILVKLKNNELCVSKEHRWFRKKMIIGNISVYGTPVVIPTMLLEYSHTKILNLLLENFNNYSENKF